MKKIIFIFSMLFFVAQLLLAAQTERLLNAGGRCLDVLGPELYHQGGQVHSWDCNDAANQQWYFDDKSRLVSQAGRCLDVPGGQLKNNGAPLQIWDCNDAPNQQWQFDTQERLVNGGGKCLDIAGADLLKTGGRVQIWDCNNAPNQRWWFLGKKPDTTTSSHKPAPNTRATPSDTSPTAPETTTAADKADAYQEAPAPFKGVVAAHNQWRAEVGLSGLNWSDDIAAHAKEWAQVLESEAGTQTFCNMRHRDQNRRYGENLAGGYRLSPQVVVDMWASEKKDYDITTNRCAAGKVCGHYTQIVWKNSKQLGCATAQCGNGSQVWICNYNPPGNYVGQTPY
ncbi:RICIN domain-containing protein [Candidatus Venteria ishoeyi]|uniref:Extracellular exo-alpha-L-arabinofuranosidase n=1 Tax=Candidatus Venteria ishoeyi TaxID=1899563 RepID=A0A1H6FAR0_9GAMM|nr:CAP domain-containing protein [Candidatus Venteria ishoeyi]SEH06095.1 Extracellular exo-alpha-L-arabinofuranosidase precursor [Candidatus Venteria ishoeyi]